MEAINIALFGLGTVGAGVVNLLQENANELASRAGVRLNVTKALVRSAKKARGCDSSHIAFVDNADAILNDETIDVVVELIGGTTDAFDIIEGALKAGKPVVTANKALLAERGTELFALSCETKTPLLFEAAVAGGIPIIKTLQEGLVANRIEWIAGVINGTCNYILSTLARTDAEFDDVLAQAQAQGFAEADPRADIDGIDSAHKISLLAAIAFGTQVDFAHVDCEGIANLSRVDTDYAGDFGFCVKSLALARRCDNGELLVSVSPTLINKSHLLASVSDEMNAVMCQTNMLGPSFSMGRGAGSLPTASSVVADLVDIVRHRENAQRFALIHPVVTADAGFSEDALAKNASPYYVRLRAQDKPGVMASLTQVLAGAKISISSMVQYPLDTQTVDIVLLTHMTTGQAVSQALGSLSTKMSEIDELVHYRVADFLY